MSQRRRAPAAWAIVVALALTPRAARAADIARASAEFDTGVRYFEAAEYPAAARAFLRADTLAPNGEAVANAITAALKTNDYLLVVEAARRGIARSSSDPGLGTTARRALSDAQRHLAELELSCAPTPCRIVLDGAEVLPGTQFVLPGAHGAHARGEGGGRSTDYSQTVGAGTRHHVELLVEAAEPKAPPASATTPVAEADDPTRASSEGLSPGWFYAGAALTGVLLGVTIWSGIDTLNARNAYDGRAPASAVDDIEGRRLRTDLLLLATAVAGGGAAVVGLTLVDWKSDSPDVSRRTRAHGAIVTWRARF